MTRQKGLRGTTDIVTTSKIRRQRFYGRNSLAGTKTEPPDTTWHESLGLLSYCFSFLARDSIATHFSRKVCSLFYFHTIQANPERKKDENGAVALLLLTQSSGMSDPVRVMSWFSSLESVQIEGRDTEDTDGRRQFWSVSVKGTKTEGAGWLVQLVVLITFSTFGGTTDCFARIRTRKIPDVLG